MAINWNEFEPVGPQPDINEKKEQLSPPSYLMRKEPEKPRERFKYSFNPPEQIRDPMAPRPGSSTSGFRMPGRPPQKALQKEEGEWSPPPTRQQPTKPQKERDDPNFFEKLGTSFADLGLSAAEGIARLPNTMKRLAQGQNELIEKHAGMFGLDIDMPRNPVGALGDAAEEYTNPTAERIGRHRDSINKTDPVRQSMARKNQELDQAFEAALSGDVKPVLKQMADPDTWGTVMAQAAPSLSAALATGGLGAGAQVGTIAALEAFESTNSAAEFERRTGQKIDPLDYLRAQAQVVGVNTALEKFGIDKLMGVSGKRLWSSMLKGGFTEGATEGAQGLNQNLATRAYDQSQSLTEGILPGVLGGAGTGAMVGAVRSRGSASDELGKAVDKHNPNRKADLEQMEDPGEDFDPVTETYRSKTTATADPRLNKTSAIADPRLSTAQPLTQEGQEALAKKQRTEQAKAEMRQELGVELPKPNTVSAIPTPSNPPQRQNMERRVSAVAAPPPQQTVDAIRAPDLPETTDALADPAMSRTEALADPRLSKTEAIADPALRRTEAIADPALRRTDAIADPRLSKTEAIADPALSRTDAIADPRLSKTEALADPALSRTEALADPALNKVEAIAAPSIREAAQQTREPTENQKKAGNYKKGTFVFPEGDLKGLTLAIENAAGTERKGKNPEGKPWAQVLTTNYGYLKGTKDNTGEGVDVFATDDADKVDKVYVIDQVDPKSRRYDEPKVVMGANSAEEAREIYESNYEPGWQGFDGIREFGTKEFKRWLNSNRVGRRVDARPADQRLAKKKKVRNAASTVDELIQTQPKLDIETAHKAAQANQKTLADVGQRISKKIGAQFVDPGVKNLATAKEKMERKGYADTSRMTDLTRGGFRVDSPEKADEIAATLSEEFDVLDEGWSVTPAGYIDRKVLVRFPDGHVGEIQLWDEQMYTAKFDQGGEETYQKWRSMPPGPEADALLQKQLDLYAKARAASGGRWDSVYSLNQSLNRSRNASSESTAEENQTSFSSTSDQPAPGSSTARAETGRRLASTSSTAGRPSQLVNNLGIDDTSSTNDSVSGDSQKVITGQDDSVDPEPIGQDVDGQRNPLEGRDPLRMDSSEEPAQLHMSRDKVQTAVQEKIAKWKGAPPVVAVQSQDELPLSAADRERSQGKKIKGYVREGKVYLVADNLSSSREALQIAMHEVVGHYGMQGMMGDKFNKLLDEVWVAYNGDKGAFKGITDLYKLDPTKKSDQRIAAEEMIAHMAESGEKPGLLRRIIANVRLWLRDMGIKIDLNDDDIKQLLIKARNYVRKGKGRRTFQDRLSLHSTRLPKAMKAKEDPLNDMLVIDTDSMKASPKTFEKNMELVKEYPGVKISPDATPEESAEQFIEQVKSNLLWLHDQVPPETRARSKLWYDGANRLANEWAKRYNSTPSAVAAAIAALSPQKDWFMNVTQAERVLDIITKEKNTPWSKEMSQTAQRLYEGNEDYMQLAKELEGKTYAEVESRLAKAMWVRTFDQAYNSPAHRIITPEGDIAGWRTYVQKKEGLQFTKAGWGSFGEIAKSISAFENPTRENISEQLGGAHKVRNFYNNIFDPKQDGFVTIDTHAVAAALLRPLAGSSVEVTHNLSGGSNSAVTGTIGTYGLYADAYRQAAAERGILAREMQSITWEAVRGLFEAKFKSKKNKAAISEMWEEYSNGSREFDEVREQVREFAGGIAAPEWERSSAGVHDPEASATYARKVDVPSVPAGSTQSDASGAGSTGSADVSGRFALAGGGSRGGSDRSQADQGAEPWNDAQEEGPQTLEGLPKSSLGPVPAIKEAAHRYVQQKGLPLRRQKTYVKADPERGARIAQAFEDMKHDPEDPEVLAAYQAMIDETLEQYQVVKELGIDIDWIEEGMDDPYPEGPKQVHEDLHRGHLWVFPTTSGFGSLNDIKDNPLLQETDEVVKGKRMLANDVFRIVHDVFGHGKEGVGFGPTGEENAWQAHVRMYSPLAAKAMTSETRGQNSWVNFGPYGERNRANQRETIFADQKIGLLPDWAMTDGMAPDIEEDGRFALDHGDADLNSMQAKIGMRKPPLIQRMQEKKEKFKQEFVQGTFQALDGLRRAEQDVHGDMPAEQSAYVAARMTSGTSAQFEVLMEHGTLEWRDGMAKIKDGSTGLMEILDPVKKNLDLWLLYMAGKRAARLKAEGREAKFTDVEIRKAVSLGQRFPEFRRAADGWAKFNKDMLDFAQESGVIDPASRAMWEHSDYIPFFRLMENGDLRGPGGSKGVANQVSPIKTLQGSELQLNDLLDNMMLNTMQLLSTSMKNHAMRQAVENLNGTPYMRDATNEFKPELIPMSEVKKTLEDRGVDVDQLPADALAGVQKMMAMKPPSGKDVVRVLINGKPRYYRVSDPLLFRSLTFINKESWPAWMKGLQMPKRVLTQMVTADPGFMVRNFIRDSMQAFVVNRDASIPIAGSFHGALRAFKGSVSGKNRDPALMAILASGAGFSGSGYVNNGGDPGEMSRAARAQLASKGIKTENILDSARKYANLWSRITAVGEQANRINAYAAAKKAGKSDLQAAYEAKDFMDFSARGDWPVIQFLAETVPFFSARLAGMHRLGRGLKERPGAFLAKGSMVTMASLALFLAYREDERYKALEDWDKNTYHHFWVGGEHFRIPKAFEVGAFFSTIPERALDEYLNTLEGKHGAKAAQGFGQQLMWVLSETFNFGTVGIPVKDSHLPAPVPQAFAPALEGFANYDSFRKRDIVGVYEEKLPGKYQYDYRTSPTMVELGKVTGFSPKKLEHMVNGYFGTIGNYLLMATDTLTREALDYPETPAKGPERWPVISSFYRGNDIGHTRYGTEFYNMAREVEEAHLAFKKLRDEGNAEEAESFARENLTELRLAGPTRKLQARMKQYNERIEAINRSTGLSATEKRDRIKRINEAKQYELKNSVERLEKAGLGD